MILTEQHIISPSNPLYEEVTSFCRLSKNLYNAGLYAIRQHYFETKTYLSYPQLCKLFITTKNPDYYALPTKVSQQTSKMVDQNFKSAFKLRQKGYKSRIPNYLEKNGYFVTTFTNQAISKIALRQEKIQLSGFKSSISSKQKNIQQVRLLVRGNHVVVEILYKTNPKPKKEKQNRICGLDVGLNNLGLIGSNVMKSFGINGRPVKSINQYYNKRLAKLKSKLNDNQKTSKRIQKLTLKRNNKIKNYLHNSSRYIINQLVSNDIDTLVIGKNVGWKQEINIGARNNQNFVMCPFAKFIDQLKYKAEQEGIEVIIQEESYTSKCSFIDNEPICKQINYVGKRIKRGLFRSKDGKLINADLNGALNIIKKVVPTAFSNGIEAIVVAPLAYNM